jgi:hypothetical protein
MKEVLLSRAKNMKISCSAAMKVADELGQSPGVVGHMLDELGIKVAECQLGCFGGGKEKKK